MPPSLGCVENLSCLVIISYSQLPEIPTTLVGEMEDRASQYCRLAHRVHISQFRFTVWQKKGFSHFRNSF